MSNLNFIQNRFSKSTTALGYNISGKDVKKRQKITPKLRISKELNERTCSIYQKITKASSKWNYGKLCRAIVLALNEPDFIWKPWLPATKMNVGDIWLEDIQDFLPFLVLCRIQRSTQKTDLAQKAEAVLEGYKVAEGVLKAFVKVILKFQKNLSQTLEKRCAVVHCLKFFAYIDSHSAYLEVQSILKLIIEHFCLANQKQEQMFEAISSVFDRFCRLKRDDVAEVLLDYCSTERASVHSTVLVSSYIQAVRQKNSFISLWAKHLFLYKFYEKKHLSYLNSVVIYIHCARLIEDKKLQKNVFLECIELLEQKLEEGKIEFYAKLIQMLTASHLCTKRSFYNRLHTAIQRIFEDYPEFAKQLELNKIYMDQVPTTPRNNKRKLSSKFSQKLKPSNALLNDWNNSPNFFIYQLAMNEYSYDFVSEKLNEIKTYCQRYDFLKATYWAQPILEAIIENFEFLNKPYIDVVASLLENIREDWNKEAVVELYSKFLLRLAQPRLCGPYFSAYAVWVTQDSQPNWLLPWAIKALLEFEMPKDGLLLIEHCLEEIVIPCEKKSNQHVYVLEALQIVWNKVVPCLSENYHEEGWQRLQKRIVEALELFILDNDWVREHEWQEFLGEIIQCEHISEDTRQKLVEILNALEWGGGLSRKRQ